MLTIIAEQTIDRYGIICSQCHSVTWYDNDEVPTLATQCWRCGEIINSDL